MFLVLATAPNVIVFVGSAAVTTVNGDVSFDLVGWKVNETLGFNVGNGSLEMTLGVETTMDGVTVAA